MGPSGGTYEPKCIGAIGSRAHAIARALAELAGHRVVDDGADLLFIDAERVDDVPRQKSAPIVAVSARRLRAMEVDALHDAGASAVLDADASVLDAAFAASDLLFATYAQRRRYGRTHGGVIANLVLPNGSYLGRLLDVGRSGAFIGVEDQFEEGMPIEIKIALLGQNVVFRGRIAFVTADHAEDNEIAVEFALEDHDVAPKLIDLIESMDQGAPRVPKRRSVSAR